MNLLNIMHKLILLLFIFIKLIFTQDILLHQPYRQIKITDSIKLKRNKKYFFFLNFKFNLLFAFFIN